MVWVGIVDGVAVGALPEVSTLGEAAAVVEGTAETVVVAVAQVVVGTADEAVLAEEGKAETLAAVAGIEG